MHRSAVSCRASLGCCPTSSARSAVAQSACPCASKIGQLKHGIHRPESLRLTEAEWGAFRQVVGGVSLASVGSNAVRAGYRDDTRRNAAWLEPIQHAPAGLIAPLIYATTGTPPGDHTDCCPHPHLRTRLVIFMSERIVYLLHSSAMHAILRSDQGRRAGSKARKRT